MKKVLYATPAVITCMLYGMLAMLAGGFASFQLRAWLMILLPFASAFFLIRGKWWGSAFGIALGGAMALTGLNSSDTVMLVIGAVIAVYYLLMGILCFMDSRKKA